MVPISILRLFIKNWWELKRSVATSFISLLFVQGFGALLSFVINIILARLLGTESYGSFLSLLSVGIIASGITSFGVNFVLTKEIAAEEVEKRPKKVQEISRWAFELSSKIMLLILPVVFLWRFLDEKGGNNSLSVIIPLMALIPIINISTILSGILAGLSLVSKSQSLVNIWENIVLLIGAILLFLFSKRGVDLALWIQVFSYIFASILGIIWINIEIKRIKNRINHPFDNNIEKDKKKWTLSSLHFFSISAATLIGGRLDVVITNSLAGAEQAGFIGVASRLVQMIAIIGLVWMAWLRPRIAFDWKNQNVISLKHNIRMGVLGSTGVTLVLVVGGWLFAPTLMNIFGKGFYEAIWPFRWLSLGYIPWSLSVPFFVLLTMGGKERIASIIIWFQMILIIILSLLLAPSYGAIGCAWAKTFALSISSIAAIIIGMTTTNRFVNSEKLIND